MSRYTAPNINTAEPDDHQHGQVPVGIDGVPHKTVFTSGGEGVGFRLGGADLALGNHPIADELRSLGLPKRALMTMWMETMRGRFEAPERLRGAASL